MKKNKIKKLRLSRETLHILQDSDSRKALGGAEPSYDQNMSCQSAGACCGGPTPSD